MVEDNGQTVGTIITVMWSWTFFYVLYKTSLVCSGFRRFFFINMVFIFDLKVVYYVIMFIAWDKVKQTNIFNSWYSTTN